MYIRYEIDKKCKHSTRYVSENPDAPLAGAYIKNDYWVDGIPPREIMIDVKGIGSEHR